MQAEHGSYITATVAHGNISHTIKASGSLRPQRIVAVGAQVSGQISRLAVEIGDQVKQGDLIAEIDARTQKNAREIAIVERASYQAELKTAQTEAVKYKKAYDRAVVLYNQGAGSQEDMEAALAALNSARNAIEQAQAQIDENELTIRNADIDLNNTRVNAPISGTVITVAVTVGQTVNASQAAPTLVQIAQTDVMTLKAEIAEADVAEIRPGMAVNFTLLGRSEDRYDGTLRSIDPAPKEISDNETLYGDTPIYYYGNIEVQNPDATLRYGMTAIASIVINEAWGTLIVPIAALDDGPDGSTIVSVLDDDGTAQTRQVTVGLEDGVNAQIKEGLAAGEKVIVSKPENDGMRRSRQ